MSITDVFYIIGVAFLVLVGVVMDMGGKDDDEAESEDIERAVWWLEDSAKRRITPPVIWTKDYSRWTGYCEVVCGDVLGWSERLES